MALITNLCLTSDYLGTNFETLTGINDLSPVVIMGQPMDYFGNTLGLRMDGCYAHFQHLSGFYV